MRERDGEMVRIPALVLHQFIVDILRSYGMSSGDASVAADALVDADLLGLDTHGVAHLANHPSYVPGIESGLVNAKPNITVKDLGPVLAMVDGDDGMGLVAVNIALTHAMERCMETGVGIAWVRRSYHAGALAVFARRAALEGFLTLALTSTRPSVAPTYGLTAALGTNPISVGVPYQPSRVLLLDMATSAVAAGKIERARRNNQSVPTGWIIDKEGNDSTSPNDYFQGGSLLPLGSFPVHSSHKGYGLAVMVDVATGIISGMGHSLILPTHGHAHMVACVDISRVMPRNEFLGAVQQMVDDLHMLPAVSGYRVWVPGEREWNSYEDNVANGIPVAKPVFEELGQLAVRRGLDKSWSMIQQYWHED